MSQKNFPMEPHHANSPLIVINLFGAPGVGKSKAGAGLYWAMGSDHISVELCREYAKYLTITERNWQLREEQLFLFSKQHHEQFILRGKYKFAITDSPLLLTAFYAPQDVTPPEFYDSVRAYNDTYINLNFLMTRNLSDPNEHFQDQGRWHDRKDSIDNHAKQVEFLKEWGVPYEEVAINKQTPFVLYEKIMAWEKANPHLGLQDV